MALRFAVISSFKARSQRKSWKSHAPQNQLNMRIFVYEFLKQFERQLFHRSTVAQSVRAQVESVSVGSRPTVLFYLK